MAGSALRSTSGFQNASGGCNSGVVPMVISETNPTGLKANQMAWLQNCSVRNAGISPRQPYRYRATLPLLGLFQGGSMYEPDNAFPYLIVSISGRTFRVRVDLADFAIDEITIPGDPNPADAPHSYFVQGEQFLVHQAGDLMKLPQIWDGQQMFRSSGLTAIGLPNPSFTVPNIGQPTLVTLSGPYAGAINEEFVINGYRYRQVEPNQSYFANVSGTNPSIAFDLPPAFTPLTVDAGLVISESFGGTDSGTVINGVVIGFSYTNPGLITGTGPVSLFVSGLAPNLFYEAPVSLNGRTFTLGLALTTNTLAAPAANEVWLINVDDPRAGTVVTPLTSYSQLPSGEAMDYYMGRIWIAAGREYIAGDIVGGASGSQIYDLRDSILKMTENTYTVGGGAFIVPTNAGNIRALNHAANIDSALGEGQLKVLTRRSVYSVNVVPDRSAWQNLSEPLQRVEQMNFGAIGDRCVVPVNGDLYYRSVDGVRSLTQAIRYFNQPGNTPISREETRAIQSDDRALLQYCSGIEFDNRLLMTCQPYQTDYGVAHKGVMPLNFDLLSQMDGKLAPAWEGVWEGLNIMQMWKGDFGGRERAFALAYSEENNALEIWEIMADGAGELFDFNTHGESRITWAFETPSFTWDKPFMLKELDTIEMWVDKVFGTVEFSLYYRESQSPCWNFWHTWDICSPRNECELPGAPEECPYPQQRYPQQYKQPMVAPKAKGTCDPMNARPHNQGYAFQFRVVIKGQCRVRGLLAHCFPKETPSYYGQTC